MLVHASCVQWQNKGILFLGNSGVGKSSAALRLIEKGAVLVADDYTEISPDLIATCPDTTFGKIEVRGVGIVDFPALKSTSLHLAVLCVSNWDEVERMPNERIWSVEQKSIPLFVLNAFDSLFCLKVDMLLRKI